MFNIQINDKPDDCVLKEFRQQKDNLRLCRCLMTEEGECGRNKHAYHVHTPQPSRKTKTKTNTANITEITTTLPQTKTIRKPRRSNFATLLHTHAKDPVTAGSCSSPTLRRPQQLPLRLICCLMTEEGECGRKKHAYHVHTPHNPHANPKQTNTVSITKITTTLPQNTNNTKTTQKQLTNTATHSPSRLSDCRVVFVSNARQTAAAPSAPKLLPDDGGG